MESPVFRAHTWNGARSISLGLGGNKKWAVTVRANGRQATEGAPSPVCDCAAPITNWSIIVYGDCDWECDADAGAGDGDANADGLGDNLAETRPL